MLYLWYSKWTKQVRLLRLQTYALESFSDCLRRGMTVCGRNLWTNLPDDIKERWGEDFFNAEIKQIAASIFIRNAENPEKVIQALQHAVSNTAPRIRYRPGWQSSFFFFPLSMAPTWLVDLFMAKIFGSGILPAGIRKQSAKH